MKKILMLLMLTVLTSCGVKGNPQPPLEPPTIGRGRPSFQKATKPLTIKQKANKSDKGDDWEEEEEFTEEPRK